MNQSRVESLIESGINILTGLVIAMVITQSMQGALGYQMPMSATFGGDSLMLVYIGWS